MTATGALARPRLLIVEDNDVMADAIGRMVRDVGFDVGATVGHVDKALRLVAEHEFDGAIIDINLHGDSSVPVCAALSERKVPYLFLTAYDNRSIVPAEFRATRWLTKPVDQAEFRAALSDLASRNARENRDVGLANADPGNALLDGLIRRQWEQLEPAFVRVWLDAGQLLEQAGEPAGHLYFPAGAVISLLGRAPNGKALEVGMVGREGVIGASLALGFGRATSDAIVRFAGAAWRLDAAAAKQILAANPDLQQQLLRGWQQLAAQCVETAVAAGHATIERRLARWLLMATSRADTSTLAVTHRALAAALAVRRAGVTRALHELEARELLRAEHRLVTVIDRDGLLAEADGFFRDR